MEIACFVFNGWVLLFKRSKTKSKEFFNQIVNLEDANSDIKLQAQKDWIEIWVIRLTFLILTLFFYPIVLLVKLLVFGMIKKKR